MPTVTVKALDEARQFECLAGDLQIKIDRQSLQAPDSIDLVLLGLSMCTVATVQHYLERKGLPMDSLSATASAEQDNQSGRYDNFKVILSLSDRLSEEQKKIILDVARTCRIHKTLTNVSTVGVELSGTASG